MEIWLSHCPEQEVRHRNMPQPGSQYGEKNWGSGEGISPVVQRLQPPFILVAEVTMQQGEDEKEWYLFQVPLKRRRRDLEWSRSCNSALSEEGKSEMKEKRKRKVRETRNLENPHHLTFFSSVQHTQMTKLYSHWLGGGGCTGRMKGETRIQPQKKWGKKAKTRQEVGPSLMLKGQPGPTAASPVALCNSPSLCTSVFKLLAALGLCPAAWQGHRPAFCSVCMVRWVESMRCT